MSVLTDRAGVLEPGDVIRLRKSGVVTVLGYRDGRQGYPSGALVVSNGEEDPWRVPALPWDEFELLAQAVDSDRDIEEGP